MKKGLIFICFIPTILFAQGIQDSLTFELSSLAGGEGMIGFAAAIIDQNGIIYENAFGFADLNKEIPYSINSVQPIASISKTLIGVSLLKAQELKLLELDDDINDHLPFRIQNPNFPDSVITIRHLSNHTSSLKDTKHYEKSYIFKTPIPKIYKEFPLGYKRVVAKQMVKGYNKNLDMPLDEFLKRLYTPGGDWYSKHSFGKYPPGKTMSYSNNGAAIASMIIEQASGLEYTVFIKKHILEPLGMNHSGWDMDEFNENEKSKLYPFHMEIPYYRLITLADGGFITSVHDFSKYFSAIIRGYNGESNLISPKSYDLMLKQDITYDQGVFWSVGELGDGNYIGHSGGDPGVHTIAVFDKRNNIGFICFSNTTSTSADQLSEALKTMIKYAPRLTSD